MLWWEFIHDEAVTIVYGPTMRQVKDIIWREARRGHAGARSPLPGYMYPSAAQYAVNEHRYALGFSADPKDDTGSGIHGYHSPHMLVIVTEAHAVSQVEIDALIRLNPERLLLTGNPLSTGGEFYDAFHAKAHAYNTIQIAAKDTPNIQQDRVVIPGMVTPEDVADRALVYGVESPMYRASVDAEFPEDMADAMVPLSKVLAAIERTTLEGDCECGHDKDDHDGQGCTGDEGTDDGCDCDGFVKAKKEGAILGVDVARFGEDATVIYRRQGPIARKIWTARGKSTMEIVGKINELVLADEEVDTVVVDDTGLGGGVTDRLRELALRCSVVAFIAGAKADDSERFFNAVAEAWWAMREAFMDDEIDIDNDKELLSQVTTRKYETQSDRTIKLESKKDMKKRLRKSPDEADALAMTYAGVGARPNIRFFG